MTKRDRFPTLITVVFATHGVKADRVFVVSSGPNLCVFDTISATRRFPPNIRPTVIIKPLTLRQRYRVANLKQLRLFNELLQKFSRINIQIVKKKNSIEAFTKEMLDLKIPVFDHLTLKITL